MAAEISITWRNNEKERVKLRKTAKLLHKHQTHAEWETQENPDNKRQTYVIRLSLISRDAYGWISLV